ncbi:hypothetical protein BC829DRAFT_448397 [Chytridium lagenaria]|nr:hypothetical protein BC829DRAFT_448397 [Chytridium lagenaria]
MSVAPKYKSVTKAPKPKASATLPPNSSTTSSSSQPSPVVIDYDTVAEVSVEKESKKETLLARIVAAEIAFLVGLVASEIVALAGQSASENVVLAGLGVLKIGAFDASVPRVILVVVDFAESAVGVGEDFDAFGLSAAAATTMKADVLAD